MIKNILFDLDDTLLDFKKSEAYALSKTLTELDVNHDETAVARYSEINQQMWKLLEKGELTRQEVLTKRFELFFEEIGVQKDAFVTKQMYEQNLSKGHYFIDGAENLLKNLYEYYDLYLVSNGTLHVQQGRIGSSGIKKYFKNIFISEQIGFVKPQKEFFDKVTEVIPNYNPDETVIVGDSLSSDIKGGNNAGIKTVWYNPKHIKNTTDAVVNYEIHSLCELHNVLLNM